MTSAVDEAPTTSGDLLERHGLDATHQHIVLLRRKQDMLRASQIAAEEQYLHRIGSLHADGHLTEVELAFIYRSYSEFAVPGFLKRWQACIPKPSVHRVQYILRHVLTDDRHSPNMPDGTWRGSWPLDVADRVPMYDTCVLYVLYDAANEPCYVGSSQNLRARLKDHYKDGKPFIWWTAYRCADRDAAYELEEKLLAEHMPYLNRKRGR